MKAFWVPSKAPDARQVLAKPDTATYCPASGKKLRLKDLIAVKFARTPEEDSGVYMDPVTQDTFTNASSLVVLKPTGVLSVTGAACMPVYPIPNSRIRLQWVNVSYSLALPSPARQNQRRMRHACAQNVSLSSTHLHLLHTHVTVCTRHASCAEM